jgi:DNA repair exonuclease SbcCD ATPase subunit
MDALVSAVADTASRADVEPVVGNLERRLEELASEQSALTAEIARTRETLLAETERLQTQLRELPEPAESADLEPLVNELASRLEEVARRQSAEIARTHDALRSEIEGLDARLQEFPAASESQATLELLVSDLACRLEEVTARQSTGAAEITRTHDALRSEIEGLEAKLRELPDPAPPVPPSEDEQLKRLLTAFADRIDAMERERAAIAGEASEAAQSWVDQVRPLVEGLRRRLDESDRRLEALGSTEGLTARLEELAERMQALEERPVAPPQPAPLPGDGRLRVELRALELRMQHAEAAARENREAVLVQLERLASRIEWRLQRLESGEQTEPEGAQEEPSLGQVVPLRGGAET